MFISALFFSVHKCNFNKVIYFVQLVKSFIVCKVSMKIAPECSQIATTSTGLLQCLNKKFQYNHLTTTGYVIN